MASFLFASHNNASSCSEIFPVLQTLIGSYNSAVSYLDLKVEQLEEDVDLVRADLNQLIDKVSEGNVLQITNRNSIKSLGGWLQFH